MTKHPIPEEVVAWVKRTTKAQGVTVKATDEATIEGVVSLLRDGREPKPVRDARSG